jgi:uracil-DNA glycosylase family 4
MDPARRQAYLDALGIEAWVRRDRVSEQSSSAAPATEAVDPGTAAPVGEQSPAAMLRAAMQAPEQAPQPATVSPPSASAAAAAPPVSADFDPSALGWEQLAERVASCTACELHRSRTQAVFGVGDQQARLMIVGEAPGADEDRLGEPFVGRAGQLLNAMLAAIGLQRQQVYIANILKCRPPGNRNPSVEEAAACQGYLQRQIALLQPRLILSLGAVSAHNLLGTDDAVGRLRGRLHPLPSGVPVAVTYHPAYLLRRPEEKAKAWQDLQRVAGWLQEGAA